VYIGGILVLIVFAVMLTHRIEDVAVSNRSVGRLPAAIIIGAVGALMGTGIVTAQWALKTHPQAEPTTYGIGDAFLGQYILPFELASVVLLVVLIGAIVVSRKEIRGEAGS
jgi:NADH-quinone oxidoreductase subunit J